MIRGLARSQDPTLEGVLEISHAGETHKISVKRVASARRYTLRVRAASRDVLLTIPKRGSLREARSFAEKNAAWIGARLRRLPQPIPFSHGSIIPFRGQDHRIVHLPDSRGTVWIGPGDYDGERSECIFVAGGASHIERRVRDFLKREARSALVSAVERHSTKIDRKPARVTLRDTTSRWGSCSASGALSFSWRLILSPDFVLDYLAAHEVAHLVHLDHSSAFWTLTRRLCHETDRAEAWLNAHGSKLHRYGKDGG